LNRGPGQKQQTTMMMTMSQVQAKEKKYLSICISQEGGYRTCQIPVFPTEPNNWNGILKFVLPYKK